MLKWQVSINYKQNYPLQNTRKYIPKKSRLSPYILLANVFKTVLVIYYRITNDPKTQQLKTAHFPLTVPLSGKSRHSSVFLLLKGLSQGFNHNSTGQDLLPSSFIQWLLGGFSGSQFVELRNLVLTRGWTEAVLSSLLCGLLYTSQGSSEKQSQYKERGD